MPKLARRNFTHKKEHRPVSDAPIGRPRTVVKRRKSTPMPDLIRMLWSDSYWGILEQLIDDHPELAQIITAYLQQHRSRYADRLEGEHLARYMQKQKFKLANVIQVVLSMGHQLKGTQILKLIKSGVSMQQRLETKRWQQEVKAGTILDKHTTFKYVEQMTDCRPSAFGEAETPYIVDVCIDQLHLYRGCRKGHYHRSVERTDQEGNKVKVMEVTVMNLHEYPVDNSMLGLTEEEVEWMRINGPYTEPTELVFDELQYASCLKSLYEFWEEDLFIVNEVFTRSESEGDDAALLEACMRLVARPEYTQPQTVMRVHTPRVDRDTNSYDDTQEIWNWILSKYSDAVAIIVNYDGQACGMMGNAKSVRLERYTACVPKAADMHGEGNLGYAADALYHESFPGPLSKALGFKKIEKHPQNMDKDRFDNHKDFHLAAGVAATYVLIKIHGIEVVKNPRRLQQYVEVDAGQKVLFYFKLQCAGPQIMWQRAQRSNRAHRLNQLWAYGFHTARATHHTNYQTYCVMRAHAIRCTHPRIRRHMDQTASMSMSGRMGVSQGKDRRMEYMHAQVQDFNEDPKHAVEDAIFYAQHFESLDHMNTKWNEMLGLDNSTQVEVSRGFKDTVLSMVNWIEMRMEHYKGHPTINPFTGLDLEKGDYRVKQPWIFLDKVAFGQVGPIGYTSSKKTWSQVVNHILKKKMFQVGPQIELDDGGGEWGYLDDILDVSNVVFVAPRPHLTEH